MVYSTDRSKAVVPVLVLLFAALWLVLQGDLFYVLHCVILFLSFFGPFKIAITSLGEERADLSAFRTFVRYALVWFCLFPFPLGVLEGLRCIANSSSCTTTVLSKLLTSCLTAVKNIGLDIMILFTKGTELRFFGQLKIPMMFSINLNLKTFRLLNCLHMIFLLCILGYLIIL